MLGNKNSHISGGGTQSQMFVTSNNHKDKTYQKENHYEQERHSE